MERDDLHTPPLQSDQQLYSELDNDFNNDEADLTFCNNSDVDQFLHSIRYGVNNTDQIRSGILNAHQLILSEGKILLNT